LFGPGAQFDSATFSGDAEFIFATFSGYAWFHNATFCREARFQRSTFSRIAGFYSATFSESALFDNATFSERVTFDSATFYRGARFENTIFCASAGFGSATFSVYVTFTGAIFSGTAWFDSATFSYDASFDSATFSYDASFDSAAFSGVAGFQRATFSRRAEFRSATFSGETRFEDVKFGQPVTFRGAVFRWPADFNGATIQRTVTFDRAQFSDVHRDLHRAQLVFWPLATLSLCAGLAAGLWLSGRLAWLAWNVCRLAGVAALVWSMIGGSRVGKDRIQEGHMRAFRRLTLICEEIRNRRDAAKFYRLELKAARLRWSTNAFERFVSWAYDVVSDYGESLVRPLLALGVVVAAFAAAGWSIEAGRDPSSPSRWLAQQARFDPDFLDAARYSLSRVFPFGPWGRAMSRCRWRRTPRATRKQKRRRTAPSGSACSPWVSAARTPGRQAPPAMTAMSLRIA
jgi:uncharacterized protein YjbI with pentapeptide repeats